VVARPAWRGAFGGFANPYSFYGPEEYRQWLPQAGFHPVRLELIPKDMQHADASGLRGLLRTTWFPYADRLPEERHASYVDAVIAAYLQHHPVDLSGGTHLAMIRLEVEAHAG